MVRTQDGEGEQQCHTLAVQPTGRCWEAARRAGSALASRPPPRSRRRHKPSVRDASRPAARAARACCLGNPAVPVNSRQSTSPARIALGAGFTCLHRPDPESIRPGRQLRLTGRIVHVRQRKNSLHRALHRAHLSARGICPRKVPASLDIEGALRSTSQPEQEEFNGRRLPWNRSPSRKRSC